MSSSKVTVEYFDPSGVFPLLAAQLQSRLPLRNLNWKSPTRPLRLIDSLRIELVASQETSDDGRESPSTVSQASVGVGETLQPTQSIGHGPGEHSQPSREASKSARKERRHQIPGLRQTPYLKVYLLRCDDNETYKATSRKLLREWIRTHTPPSQSTASSSTHENHDAFEWLILHVVIPDTAAATQPRRSGSSSSGAGTPSERSSSTPRWPGRGSSTILEKIRADFNVSGKSAPDRVAQIRLQRNEVPPELLPRGPNAVTSPYSESPQELQNAWNDLTAKLKTLILVSFDLRVSHYEEDIREKDTQRSLPGWNFCTFFLLKEGLARGFESVGLAEDALVGYDELSIGLDSVIWEQTAQDSVSHAGLFPKYTHDLQRQFRECVQNPPDESSESASSETGAKRPLRLFEDNPISSDKKNYRDLILSNNISILDFKCYIFARQMSLLLRLGNAHTARSKSRPTLQDVAANTASQDSIPAVRGKSGTEQSEGETEDLMLLADVCRRAQNFITSAARIMREDLLIGQSAESTQLPPEAIDNFIGSWSFAVAQQVLNATVTSALPISAVTGDNEVESFVKSKVISQPKRSSSLPSQRGSMTEPPYAHTPASSRLVYDYGRLDAGQAGRQEQEISSGQYGFNELAAHRAELFLLQRRILERIGKPCGWSFGWSAVVNAQSVREDNMTEIDLNDEKQEGHMSPAAAEKSSKQGTSRVGLCYLVLIRAMSTVAEFRALYERLSRNALEHYLAAGRTNSAEWIMGDLAVLKFDLGDYVGAAMYFSRVSSLYAETKWNLVETTMLKMQAQCLKKLHRKDEYTKALLQLLAKSAARARTSLYPRQRLQSANNENPLGQDTSPYWLDDDSVDTRGYLTELVNYSDELPYDFTVPMAKYFTDITVQPYVRHYPDKDGFQLRVCFRHLFEDNLPVDNIKVLLSSATPGLSHDIWLETASSLNIRKGAVKTWVDTNMTTRGAYIATKIILQARKIKFVHEPLAQTESKTPLGLAISISDAPPATHPSSFIMCYPRMGAFEAKISSSRHIHIGKTKVLVLECNSGSNDIHKAVIRLRSASAGLRLRTADAAVVEGQATIGDKSQAGLLELFDMPQDSTVKVEIPFEVETPLREISIRLETIYTTDLGDFTFFELAHVSIELPLDVNVYDVFKDSILFSRFNIRTAVNIPFCLLDVKLEDSAAYAVQASAAKITPMLVFPKQVVCMTYKITRKDPQQTVRKDINRVREVPLALTVKFRSIDEDALEVAKAKFSSDLKGTQFSSLGRLLVPAFVERLRRLMSPIDCERIALLNIVRIGEFSRFGWTDILLGLPNGVREEVCSWLDAWHKNNTSLTLSPPESDETVASQEQNGVVIPVAIPQVQVVHTASLYVFDRDSPSRIPQVAAVGEMLMAELRIKHTRQWDKTDTLQRAANLEDASDPVDFTYELQANPDTWLIGGQRRAQFSAREGELSTFPVMLMPLRSGHLLLPTVDIKPRLPRQQAEESNIACETDYQSQGQMILVIADIQSTTVRIDGLGPQSTVATLIDSEPRGKDEVAAG